MEETDSKAVSRLKTGDISGLESLVRRYQLKAVRAALLITRDKSESGCGGRMAVWSLLWKILVSQ